MIIDSPPDSPTRTAPPRLPPPPRRPPHPAAESSHTPLLPSYPARSLASQSSRWSFSVPDGDLPQPATASHATRARAPSPPPYDPHSPPRYAPSSSAASFSTIRSDQEVPEAERDVKWSEAHYGRGEAARRPVVRRDSGASASFVPPSTLPPSYCPDGARGRWNDGVQVMTERGRQCASPTRMEWAYATLPGEVAAAKEDKAEEERAGVLSILFFL
ncbi:hypothetical protein RQP46_007667 [Phenoliferia psychrophenolica]